MAVDDEESGTTEDPATLLKSLETKAVLNKYLFIAALSFCAILFAVMGTGLGVMYYKLSQLGQVAEQQESQPYEEEFKKLEQQLLLLADFRKSEMKKIQAYTAQLDAISNQCSLEKSAPYRDFLVSREKDYQKFIATLKSGTSDLANMTRGSREWLDGYNAELDKLSESSAARQQILENLKTK